MHLERTLVNIYYTSLERSITGDLISMIRFMPGLSSKLEIIGADIYKMDDQFAKDFCDTLVLKKDQEERIIQESFKEYICNKENLDKEKYNYKRVFNLVIEGEDAVKKISKLVGDIRIRNGVTILGRYGFFKMSADKKVIMSEFPASAPNNKEEAEAQLSLFWNKYKDRGGPLKNSVIYPDNMVKEVDNSLVLIKPNTFEGSYDPRIGDVVNAISLTGMYIVGAKIQIPTKEQMEEFYLVHKDKPFFEELVNFMSDKKSLALLYEGRGALCQIREIALKLVRYAYSESILENTIHTSDHQENFLREVRVVNFNENKLP